MVAVSLKKKIKIDEEKKRREEDREEYFFRKMDFCTEVFKRKEVSMKIFERAHKTIIDGQKEDPKEMTLEEKTHRLICDSDASSLLLGNDQSFIETPIC